MGDHYSEVGVLAAQIILKEYIKQDIASLGIKYDRWQSEQDFYTTKTIDKMWKFLTRRHLVYENDCAQWLKTSEYGVSEDRVVMTQQ